MSEQSRLYDEWVDNWIDSGKPDASTFARTALTDLPRVEMPVRYPNSRKAWPPEMWTEMQAIRRGEKE